MVAEHAVGACRSIFTNTHLCGTRFCDTPSKAQAAHPERKAPQAKNSKANAAPGEIRQQRPLLSGAQVTCSLEPPGEFPEFELIHNLSAFSLSGPQEGAAETQRCLLRLSQMFDANSKQLYEQFQDLKPTAQRHRPVLSLFNGAYCLSCFACRFPMLCPGKQLSKSEELGDLQAWTLAESSVSGRCPDMSKTLARVLLASAAGCAERA